jgi:signal transduction histidine kinase
VGPSGIGLMTANLIIGKFEGKVHKARSDAEGTAFEIHLPYVVIDKGNK